MTKGFAKRLYALVERAEAPIKTLLAFMSMAAVALVISTEFVSNDWIVPLLHYEWGTVQVAIRVVIWVTFVSTFLLYAGFRRKPIAYLKNHLLEFIVCVTWVPHYTEGPFTILNDLFYFSKLVPLDALMLIGTITHAWRVLRYTVDRFPAHPIYVTFSAFLLLVSSAGALLSHVEPQTFKTFWDGAWFALTTVTTIGYGDLTPKTVMGKVITSGLILSGISLFGIAIGLVSELVRTKLLKQDANPELTALKGEVGRLTSLLAQAQRQASRLETQNDEMHQLLTELVKQHGGHELVHQQKVTEEPPKSQSDGSDEIPEPKKPA